MPNNLTGDFDAVMQVSIRQVNGLLASLHQNGGIKDASPTFLHSVTMRIGDPPPILTSEVLEFGKWVSGAMQTMQQQSEGPDATVAYLASKAPPGIAARLQDSWQRLKAAQAETAAPGTVRGRVELQLSAPAISLPEGSTSEVTAHVFVRAHYFPDPGSKAMPEPVHGEVQVTYDVKPATVDGKRVVKVEVPSQAGKVQFIPAPGSASSAADDATISAQVRKAVRENFEPMAVAVGNDFPFSQFKALGSPSHAIALPIQLSGASVAGGSIHSVTNPFLGASEFAIGQSKEYVERTQLGGLLEKLTGSAPGFKVSLLGIFDADYRVSVSLSPLAWLPGRIEISGSVSFKTDAFWSPDGSISFTQSVTLELDVASQSVTIKPVGGPDVSESWWIPHSAAVAAFETARDKALAGAQATVGSAFNAAKQQIDTALGSFEASARSSYTALEITPDGIIVRGAIATNSRKPPVVEVADTADHGSFTALDTWIPGGRIESLVWTWLEQTHPIAWFNKPKVHRDDHRFIFPKPAILQGRPSWSTGICLRIEGTQTSPDGYVVPVDAGESCTVSSHEPILVVSPLEEAIYGIHWGPYPTPEDSLEQAISAHIDVLGYEIPQGDLTTNTLVYFAGRTLTAPLQALGEAVARMRHEQSSLRVIVVLPEGTFRDTRREVEAKLGTIDEGFAAPLMMTEDYTGAWTRTFGATNTPATYLLDARRELVWKQEGEMSSAALAAALDQHLLPAPPPRSRPLRLTVRPGDRALDALFDDDEGQTLALRRFRGERVSLHFWQSWSAPCIRELRRLQRLRDGSARPPVVIAVNGGEAREVIAETRRQNDLTFTLVHDSDRRITRLYGVRCWPTTVSIDADGIVERIQFGAAHEHAAEGRAETPEAS